MSAINEAGVRLSESEFLEWLKLKPRTMGWSAWLAYDRKSANSALAQDHTERFATHPLAVPVTGAVALVDNVRWEHLYNVRLDAPQISFASSMVASTRVGFAAQALSGAQLSVEAPESGAPRRVLKIEAFNPLQGPRLTGSVFIDDAKGEANAARQVRIDLATGEGYRLSFAHTREAQIEGGEFFGKYFAALDINSRCCLLNRLGEWEGGALVPGIVRARPFPAPDAATSGDGAVVLMIAAEGSEPGELPDNQGDWRYPIPDGHAATLLVSNDSVMSAVLDSGLRTIGEGAAFEYREVVTPDGPRTSLRATQGTLPWSVQTQVAPFASVTYGVAPALAGGVDGKGALTVTRDGNALELTWQASSFNDAQAPLLQTDGPAGTTSLDYALRIRQACRFTVDAQGVVGFALGDVAGGTWFKPVYRQAGALDALHYQHFSALSTTLAQRVTEQLAQRMSGVGSAEINPLLADGVGFPGHMAVNARAVHLPMDLALFGQMGARPGAFTLEAPSRFVLAGQELRLQTVPAQPDVAWSVSPVEGFEGDAGTISTAGVYRAPAASAIAGAFTLVKVSATKGAHTHAAVVSVMRKGLSINPLAFATWPTMGPTRLAAACVDGGPLEWSITSSSGARLQDAPQDDEGLYAPGDRLYVPGSASSGNSFSMDAITVRNPRTGETQTCHALVVEKPLVGTVLIQDDATLPPNKIQLILDAGLGALPGVEWAVHAGAGSVNAEGIYTMDPTSESPFAIITGSLFDPTWGNFFNYLILPLPLIDLDELRRVLS